MDFSDDALERYSRQIMLREVGGVGQQKLAAARVLIIGMGGLGVPAATSLAASGVGRLTLVDDDQVDLSNLARQTLYRTTDIGRPKVEAAAEHLSAMNPEVSINPKTVRADETILAELLEGQTLVLDGSDNFTTRLAVNDAAYAAGVPLVSGAAQGHAGQVGVFAPHQGDHLPCYRCFVPSHPGAAADQTCAGAGVMGPVVGLVGQIMAYEAQRLIIGMGEEAGLKGRIRILDMLTGEDRTVQLPRDPACPTCGEKP